ncbi:MAG: helix-turn-helix domain-containing protein [Nitrospirota bacterium]
MQNKKNIKFRVRDTRKKEQFVVDDAYLNGYARYCGIYATGVYIVLCRHANAEQECWPSIATIAIKLGVSDRQVNRALARLQEMNIILRRGVRKKDGGYRNEYTLLDKSVWRLPENTTTGSRIATTSPSHSDCQSQEGFTSKDSHLSLSSERDNVQKLFPTEKISGKIDLRKISFFLAMWREGRIAVSNIRSINAYLRGLDVPEGWDPERERKSQRKAEEEAEKRLEAARKAALMKSGYVEE